jgi:hypothetical protein
VVPDAPTEFLPELGGEILPTARNFSSEIHAGERSEERVGEHQPPAGMRQACICISADLQLATVAVSPSTSTGITARPLELSEKGRSQPDVLLR